MSQPFRESVVEDAALAWLEGLGWSIRNGQDIAPDALTAERADYSHVVLELCPRDVLACLNPELPAEVLEDILRNFTRPVCKTVEAFKEAGQ